MMEMPMIAKGAEELHLLPGMSNRHGLVAGATGTGKTVTLQVMAEALSSIGVPVFAADVKGDLSGISQPGKSSPKLDERVKSLGLGDWTFSGCPVVFWDVFGKEGHPVRATVSEMGPLLFSRILNLNDTQTDVLTLVFKIADDNGLLLLDMKDLQAMLQHVSENAKQYQTSYGNISAASIGAIQRGLVALGQQGGDLFFGEPALNIEDLIQTDANGKGIVNILAADKLLQSPQLYATFLLWLMSELFEKLPEVGDPEKPKLVFFFDEAHLLFNDLPPVLQSRIEQVVRLIRSKGVGVFFVTQNPIDVPDTVLGQLGNRVQHALRAFSPKDQKAVKAAAQTFRSNPKLDVEEVITQLGVGEALISFLDEKGIPGVVERAMVCPPHSQIGPITPEQRAAIIKNSVIAGVYETPIDRESAYEKLKGKVAADGAGPTQGESQSGWLGSIEAAGTVIGNALGGGSSRRGDTVVQAMVKSAARSMGSTVGRQLIRGVLGSLLGGSSRR
ncbi:helicase HerA-like C-terminal domain-containing protein [Edaphobacter flagellatus]|uniref:helicase HerA-like C-terminal domain-containing protein n=1 Tax=Edaphobacter flagellatus TaxID=1933044 RepID=UPI0021B345EF|nr:helicase HerA-like C-terminal domain-containing protein [Edaphobacter flagellatus]